MSAAAPSTAAVGVALARALGSRRDEYNQRFVQARRQRAELDGSDLLQFLRAGADPLVQGVADQPGWDADRVDQLVSAAFDAALELGGQRLLGVHAARPLLERAWQGVLPAALARWPQWSAASAICALCNALFHLVQADGARPADWLAKQQRVLPHCADPDTWLRAGQVAAWLCGLAQYREAALELLRDLPPAIAGQLLGLTPDRPVEAALLRLREDPWFNPAVAVPAASLRVAATVGAFRGFGGLFPQPPLLSARGEQLFVLSGEHCWQLLADAFGQHLARVPPTSFAAGSRGQPLPPGLKLKGERIEEAGQVLDFDGLGGISSLAVTGATLALSFSASHSIRLLPLT